MASQTHTAGAVEFISAATLYPRIHTWQGEGAPWGDPDPPASFGGLTGKPEKVSRGFFERLRDAISLD